MLRAVKVMGYNVYDGSLDAIPLNAGIINTINPHSYCVAREDKLFRKSLKNSQILLPDGIGMVLASKYLKNRQIQKIAGYDIFIHMCEKLQKESGTCFFLGASEYTLQKITVRLKKEYPDISVGTYSPPFRQQFSEAENEQMIKAVNEVSPDVLFVGMTAPKQEKWVYENHQRISARAICSIGAVFDFYAGNTPRAPKVFIKLGLEWLHRSFFSRRLLKRNLISNPKFVIAVLKNKIAG